MLIMHHYSFILLIFFSFTQNINALPQICGENIPRITYKGADFLQKYIGKVLYVVRLTHDNRNFPFNLQQLNSIGGRLNEVKIFVFLTPDVNINDINTLQNQYRFVTIDQEDTKIVNPYSQLNAGPDDRFLFDRCGRLSNIRKGARSSVDDFYEIYNLLKKATEYASCGFCRYYTTNNPQPVPNQVALTPNQQYQRTHTSSYQDGQSHPEQLRKQQQLQHEQNHQQKHHNYDATPNNLSNRPPQQTHNPQQNTNQRYTSNQGAYQTNRQPQVGNYNPNEYQRNGYDSGKISDKKNPPKQAYQLRQEYNKDGSFPPNYDVSKTLEPAYISRDKIHPKNNNNKDSQPRPTATYYKSNQNNKETPELAPLYHDGEVGEVVDEDYEYLDFTAIISTTQVPQTQIPPTTQHSPLWPTNNPEHTDYQINTPCIGFTDDICFQQKASLDPRRVHRCCLERVLFTDLCISGKCTNTTIQLCCIQKFLQSKYKCCHDEAQARTTTPTNEFSKCCFDNFIGGNDECCPSTYAESQWKGIYDLCLPNVDFDLSHIKVPTFQTASVVVAEFDFGKTDEWKFECPYGKQAQQWAYFEPDLNSTKPTPTPV
uniref:SelP_N domain-containing protein n=1 Tax=Rhabditophanes sp. KR3021 TaxID=114890 RepID=A0AC35TX84_9BILA